MRDTRRVKPVRTLLVLSIAALWGGLAAAQDESPPEEKPAETPAPPVPGWWQTRGPLYAARAAVVTDDPAATAAALDVLRTGGNAADAAVAASAVLGVARPAAGGPGGDAAVLYWDAAEGKAFGISGVGRLPQAAPAADSGKAPDAAPGGRWTVPGAVDAWSELHGRFGKKTWAEVLAPAVRAAREGVPASGAAARERTDAAAGVLTKNEPLAATYETLGRLGRAAFYEGELAEKLVEASGGSLSREDLASHRSEWVEPVAVEYRGQTVLQLPPPARGVGVLQTLALLSAYDLSKMGPQSAAFLHLALEAGKAAEADVRSKVGDPDGGPVDVPTMLAAEYLGELRRGLDPNKASPRPVTADREACVGVIAADAEGNVCCLVSGLGRPMGAGVAGPLGFAVQDGLSRFGAEESPNAAAAGRRPAHELLPTLVVSPAAGEGKASLRFALAAGGTDAVSLVLAKVIVRLVDFAENPQGGVDAGRLLPVPAASADAPPVVVTEAGVSEAVRAELAAKGREVRPAEAAAFGSVLVLGVGETGVLSAAADPRGAAAAGGF